MLYEYKIITRHYLEITEDELNCLGQEGWSLAGTFSVGVETARLIFTRQAFYSGDSRLPWQMKIWTGNTPAINIDIGRGAQGER